jgi:integrase
MRSADDVDRALRRIVHGAVTLERAAHAYAERADLAPNTVRRVRSFVAGAGAPLLRRELDGLDAPLISAWLEKLSAQGAAPSSIGVLWRTLRSIVQHAVLRGWIGRAPWGTWRPKLRGAGRSQREACRDPGELVRLLEAARAIGPPELEAKIAAAALLGLRQGEIAGLRWSDVDEQTAMVTIARQYAAAPTKHRRINPLRAGPTLFGILAAQRARLESAELYLRGGPVFPDLHASKRGAPAPYAKGECLTTRQLRAAVERANLPNVSRWSPHSLRDTFVTLEAKSSTHDGDLRALAERSRHGSIGSLLRYMRTATREPAPIGFELGAPPTPRALPEPKK